LKSAEMSVEQSTAKQQVKAWKELIHSLPIILSAKNRKAHVESNFEEIDQACTEIGQTPDAVFRSLKRMSSAILRKAKKVESDEDESSSSDSSDDDEALEFSNVIEKSKPKIPIKRAATDRTCIECDGPISKTSKGLCRECYDKLHSRKCTSCGRPVSRNSKKSKKLCKGCYNDLHSRKCTSCGGPISSNSKGLCRDCNNNRGSSRSCDSCGGPISNKSKGLCKECYHNRPKSSKKSVSSKKAELKKPVSGKKAESKKVVSNSTKKDICAQCMNDCIIFEDDMCEECYSETVNKQGSKRAKDNSEDTPVKRNSSKKKKSKRPANDSSSESNAFSKKKKRRMTEDSDD